MRRDYELLSPLPDGCADVRFAGTFAGAPVIWTMHLCTLAAWSAASPGQTPPRQDGAAAEQFMDIRTGGAGEMQITVALDVPLIDEPTVRKTVIMIRNYKRLRLGRHTWGGRATGAGGESSPQ
jgi:hypothetical protein